MFLDIKYRHADLEHILPIEHSRHILSKRGVESEGGVAQRALVHHCEDVLQLIG